MTTAPENRPIFVAGFPRSGTTLLQALIGAHPRIAAPPEMHYFRRIVRVRAYWGDLEDDGVLRRVIDATVNPPTGLLAEAEFDVDRIFARARTGPRTYPAVLDAVMTDFADHRGKARWCEKTPLQDTELVWRAFPDAQVVHIVRDPRATVASSAKMLGLWANPTMAARLWRQYTYATARAGAERGPSRYFRIRYEDLTRDPQVVMRLVFTFLGEDFDPDAITDVERRRATVPTMAAPWQSKALEAIKPAVEGEWRGAMSRQHRLRVAAVIGDVLPVLGYVRPRRATQFAGAALNALYAPKDLFTAARMRRHTQRKRTPEELYQESIRTQEELVELFSKTVESSR